MVDHLQSRGMPWRQYASHVKVRGTLSKLDVLRQVEHCLLQMITCEMKNVRSTMNTLHCVRASGH